MSLTTVVAPTDKLSVVKSESVYKWEINNFLVDCKETGQYLESAVFFLGGYRWQIRLYPQGKREEFKESISLVLKSFNESKLSVRYSFSILDNKNEKYSTADLRAVFKLMGKECGRLNFIEHNRLMDTKNNLLLNNKLTILCEISIDIPSDAEKQEIPESIENLCDFEKFLNNKKFSDVKFIVDGKEFHAHKMILSNRSEVFAAMFEHDIEENAITIEDIDFEVLKETFRFIYTGKVNNIEKMAKELLIAADKYALVKLKCLCMEYLCAHLSVDNVIKCLEFADTYSVDLLKTRAMDFLVWNAKDIVNNAEFKLIKNLHEDIILEVFRRLAFREKTDL